MRRVPEPIHLLLGSRSFFYIFGHSSPDGDSVGSCLAFASLLHRIGKRCVVVSEDIRDFLRIKAKIEACAGLSEDVTVVSEPDFSLSDQNSAAIVFLDCSEKLRIGGVSAVFDKDLRASEILAESSVAIDHHPVAKCDCRWSYCDADAPAACYLVAQVIDEEVGLSDRYVRNALFYGIVSDTGFFRFLNGGNSHIVFSLCAKLTAQSDIPVNRMSAIIDGGKDTAYIAYYARLIEGARYLCGGRAILVADDEVSYHRYGKAKRPSDELYRLFMRVDGVEVVAFVKLSDKKGYTDGSVRVSPMSDFDASEFCSKFGGGGHIKASGFHIAMSFAKTVEAVKRELEMRFANVNVMGKATAGGK